LEANLETSADPIRCAFAVAALALNGILSPILGPEVPFLTLWPAVVFSSWFCGFGASIVSVSIGVAGAWCGVLPPHHPFMPQGMRERARQFHREMNVESDEAGTAIHVIFPTQGPSLPDSGAKSARFKPLNRRTYS
jgi:Domain of unknown function (DUF4118)